MWGGGFIQPITIHDVVLTPEEEREAEDAAKRAKLLADDSDEEEEEGKKEEIDPADVPYPEGTIYDNVEQSVAVLRGFWLAHSDKLKTIPIQFADELNKYDLTLKKFAEAHRRVTSLAGREGMDFIDVRAIVDDDDHDDEQDDLDECILESWDYTTTFRRECCPTLSIAHYLIAISFFKPNVLSSLNLILTRSSVGLFAFLYSALVFFQEQHTLMDISNHIISYNIILHQISAIMSS